MNCYSYNFFSKFRIIVESDVKNSFVNYIAEEYKFFCGSKNTNNLPIIGYVIAIDKIEVPKEAVVLITNELFYYENSIYYLYLDSFIKLYADSANFRIEYHSKSDPFLIFYITEIFIRYYSSLFDIVFLHASAFIYNEKTFIINAFGGTGKTNLLIEILLNGGTYLSDDLIPVDINLNVYAYPKKINLLYYNLQYSSELLKKVNCKKYLLDGLNLVAMIDKRSLLYRLIGYRIEGKLKNKLNIKINYEIITKTPVPNYPILIDNFYWMERNEYETSFFKIDACNFIKRMNLCLSLESSYFVDFDRYLPVFFDDIYKLKKLQRGLITSISNTIEIKGIRKKTNNESILFDLIIEK